MYNFIHNYTGKHGICTIKWDLSNGGCFMFLGSGTNFVAQPDFKSEFIIKYLMYSINDLKKENEELKSKLSEL